MRRSIRAAVLIALLSVALTSAQDRSSQSQAGATAQSRATKAESGVSAGDIAAATAAHKVWVNLDTGIYHKSGRWYGKTKNGRFMSIDEAKKAGYKAAKRD
ncbi:MAG TPA: hypothetical protein VFB28_11225 [Terriglobales bacterium]|nr:hypothetical protein [Terriglobales bacterium]